MIGYCPCIPLEDVHIGPADAAGHDPYPQFAGSRFGDGQFLCFDLLGLRMVAAFMGNSFPAHAKGNPSGRPYVLFFAPSAPARFRNQPLCILNILCRPLTIWLEIAQGGTRVEQGVGEAAVWAAY